MKVAMLMFVVLAASEVAWGAPAAAPANDRPDPMLTGLLVSAGAGEATSRTARQSQEPMSPLAQLLQDALAIPQVALQAVSRLLTNPRNTIGQNTRGSQRYAP